MKDPKDILKEVQADILGVSPDSITFSNFRDRKKKKKKVKKTIESESNSATIDNQEGFGITDVRVEFCSYDKINGRRKIVEKNNLEEWGAFDFFYYAQKKYIGRYSSSWGLNVGGSSVEINRIRDKFYDLFGFCCNLIMRDYIDFFFNNYIDTIVRSEGAFYFSQMHKEKMICEFYDGYDFPQSFSNYTNGEKERDKGPITNHEIKEAFMIGDTSLISNYGIVISFNWLIVVKKMSSIDATRLVVSACRDMLDKGMVGVIKSATELYSPYPSKIPFKSPQLVMNKIDRNVKLDVEFGDNDKLIFLQQRR